MITLRAFQPTDKNLVYATFLKSLYFGCSFMRQIDQDAYYAGYGKVLDHLVQKPGLDIRMCCLMDDPDVVVGWAMVEPEAHVLHYIYVKSAWRNQGIAKLLLLATELNTCTHLTDLSTNVTLLKKLKFNPFLI